MTIKKKNLSTLWTNCTGIYNVCKRTLQLKV